MSYAILSVIYGIPLTSQASEEIDRRIDGLEEGDPTPELEEPDEDGNVAGFTTLYTGGDYYAGYCGVMLQDDLSVCEDYFTPDQFDLKPTLDQMVEAELKIAEADPGIKALCPQPGVYIVISYS